MKKELIYYSVLTIVIALLLAFETNLFEDETGLVSKVIDIESFEKLDIDLDCDIYVSLGEEQKIVFEGPSKYASRVVTKLKDGVLTISCKKAGLLSQWISPDEEVPQSVSLYIKLTDSDQLIMPEKGTLISNETLQLIERCDNMLFSLNANLNNILKMLGNQIGQIRIR